MSDSANPSVASRFVSESSLEAAKKQREDEWKAAYARLGEKPPEREEEPYDGRSLWEKLQANKDKKQEAFDEAIKFKNQFRALDEDEISFLDSMIDDNQEEEAKKKAAIQEELNSFRAAVLAKQAAPAPTVSSASSLSSTIPAPTPTASSSSASTSTTAKPPPPKSGKKKDSQKKMLAGVIVKKKEKPAPVKRSASDAADSKPEGGEGKAAGSEGGGEESEAKKRKVEEEKPVKEEEPHAVVLRRARLDDASSGERLVRAEQSTALAFHLINLGIALIEHDHNVYGPLEHLRYGAGGYRPSWKTANGVVGELFVQLCLRKGAVNTSHTAVAGPESTDPGESTSQRRATHISLANDVVALTGDVAKVAPTSSEDALQLFELLFFTLSHAPGGMFEAKGEERVPWSGLRQVAMRRARRLLSSGGLSTEDADRTKRNYQKLVRWELYSYAADGVPPGGTPFIWKELTIGSTSLDVSPLLQDPCPLNGGHRETALYLDEIYKFHLQLQLPIFRLLFDFPQTHESVRDLLPHFLRYVVFSNRMYSTLVSAVSAVLKSVKPSAGHRNVAYALRSVACWDFEPMYLAIGALRLSRDRAPAYTGHLEAVVVALIRQMVSTVAPLAEAEKSPTIMAVYWWGRAETAVRGATSLSQPIEHYLSTDECTLLRKILELGGRTDTIGRSLKAHLLQGASTPTSQHVKFEEVGSPKEMVENALGDMEGT